MTDDYDSEDILLTDVCLNCFKDIDVTEDDMFSGICKDCWDDISEHMKLGHEPFVRKWVFDDEQP